MGRILACKRRASDNAPRRRAPDNAPRRRARAPESPGLSVQDEKRMKVAEPMPELMESIDLIPVQPVEKLVKVAEPMPALMEIIDLNPVEKLVKVAEPMPALMEIIDLNPVQPVEKLVKVDVAKASLQQTWEMIKLNEDELMFKDVCAEQIMTNEDRRLLMEFGMIRSTYKESGQFLRRYPKLICHEAANFLAYWSISLDIAQKPIERHCAVQQSVYIRLLVEIAKLRKHTPKGGITSFVARLDDVSGECRDIYEKHLRKFNIRVDAITKRHLPTLMEQDGFDMLTNMASDNFDYDVEVLQHLPEIIRKAFDAELKHSLAYVSYVWIPDYIDDSD